MSRAAAAGCAANHLRLLWEGRRQLASVRAAWQIEINKGVGPARKRRNHPAKDARALKETTTTCGADEVFGDLHDINLPFPRMTDMFDPTFVLRHPH